MSELRPRARHAALDALSVAARWRGAETRGLQTPRVHFPYLHSVPEHEEDVFRQFLATLESDHTFISYSEGVQRILEGRVDRPYLAFSFDDGFASNVRTAAILEEFGTVGCFFVTTGFIGTRDVTSARAFFGYSRGIEEPAMTWTDLSRLKDRGHEIGNHTFSHRCLADISHQRMVDEVEHGVGMLRQRLGGVEHFAWPFGRFFHFSEGAAAAVFAAGHRSCASAERGSHPPGPPTDPQALCIRRDQIMTSWPQRHARYFLARSATQASDGRQGWPTEWAVPQ